MKKRTKIMSLLLALMLAAALVPTALVQAFASEEVLPENVSQSTEDEPQSIPQIVSFEMTKAPDKTFTEPAFIKTVYSAEEWEKANEIANLPENTAKSIAFNMTGAEFTLHFDNGDSQTYTVGVASVVTTQVAVVDENVWSLHYFGSYKLFEDCWISVRDLGDYKAEIELSYIDGELKDEITVNHSGTDTEDNPATPGEVITPSEPGNTVPTSSQNGASSTSDTPSSNNTPVSNNNNGTVATGGTVVSAILLSVLMLASCILAVIGRKKRLF